MAVATYEETEAAASVDIFDYKIRKGWKYFYLNQNLIPCGTLTVIKAKTLRMHDKESQDNFLTGETN